MNVSTHVLVDPTAEQPESLADAIQRHHSILARISLAPTGDVALIPEGPSHPGSLRVWSKIDDGAWLYVDPDGVIHVAACPMSVSAC